MKIKYVNDISVCGKFPKDEIEEVDGIAVNIYKGKTINEEVIEIDVNEESNINTAFQLGIITQQLMLMNSAKI